MKPATVARPAASTTSASPSLSALPPRKVAYSRALSSVLSRTRASPSLAAVEDGVRSSLGLWGSRWNRLTRHSGAAGSVQRQSIAVSSYSAEESAIVESTAGGVDLTTKASSRAVEARYRKSLGWWGSRWM